MLWEGVVVRLELCITQGGGWGDGGRKSGLALVVLVGGLHKMRRPLLLLSLVLLLLLWRIMVKVHFRMRRERITKKSRSD